MGLTAKRMADLVRGRGLKQLFSHHLLGQVGDIRASPSRDIYHGQGLSINRQFHVRGPDHEVLTVVPSLEDIHGLEKRAVDRNHLKRLCTCGLQGPEDIQFLNQGKLAIEMKDYQVANKLLIKVQDILFELMVTLDMEKGGEKTPFARVSLVRK